MAATLAPDQASMLDDARRFFRETDLPPSMFWAAYLSELNYRGFVAELWDALKDAERTGDVEALEILLESWEATAGVDATPGLAELLNEGPKDELVFASGRVTL
ncbi:MAG: hypothetical protein ACKVVT_01370 [Dehalococcoidia bacterium]